MSVEIKIALLGSPGVGKATVLNALFQEQFDKVPTCPLKKPVTFFRVSTTRNGSKSGTSPENGDEEDVIYLELDKPLFQMHSNARLTIVEMPDVVSAGSSHDYVEKAWEDFDCVVVVIEDLSVNTREQVNLLRLVKDNVDNKKDIPVIVLMNKVDDPDDNEVTIAKTRKSVEQIFQVQDRKKSLEAVLKASKESDEKKKTLARKKASPAFITGSAEDAFIYGTANKVSLEEFKKIDKHFIDTIGREEIGRSKWKRLSEDEQYEEVYDTVTDPDFNKDRVKDANFDTFLTVLGFFCGGEEAQENLVEKQLRTAMANISSHSGFADQMAAVCDTANVLGIRTEALKVKFWKMYEKIHKEAVASYTQNPVEVKALNRPMTELIAYATGLHKKLHASAPTAAEVKTMEDAKKEDEEKIMTAMKTLIKEQIGILIEEEARWSSQASTLAKTISQWEYHESKRSWINSATGAYFAGHRDKPPRDSPFHWEWDKSGFWKNKYSGVTKPGKENENPAAPRLRSWSGLSPYDWSTIITSILLNACNDHFCDNFGEEISDLEWLARTGKFIEPDYCPTHKLFHNCGKTRIRFVQEYLKGSYVDGVFVPDDPEKYKLARQIVIPKFLSEPTHFGHLGWMFCEYSESHAKELPTKIQLKPKFPTVKLAANGPEVSAVSMGLMGVGGGWTAFDEKTQAAQAIEAMKKYLELGGNHVDTSDAYGDGSKGGGESELILGEYIKEFGRDKFFVATKCTLASNLSKNEKFRNWGVPCADPEYIKEACDQSLKRLGIKCIDLYYLHRADPKTPIEQSMQTLKELVEAGKIKYVGLSEHPPELIRRAHAVHPVTACEYEWSVMARDLEADVVPVCKELGIGIVSYSPLARGLLTGTQRSRADLPDDFRKDGCGRYAEENMAKNVSLVDKFAAIAKKKNCTPGQLAIAWVLAQHSKWGVPTVPIPASTKPHRVEENMGAAYVKLTLEDLKEIEDAVPPSEVAGARYTNPYATYNQG